MFSYSLSVSAPPVANWQQKTRPERRGDRRYGSTGRSISLVLLGKGVGGGGATSVEGMGMGMHPPTACKLGRKYHHHRRFARNRLFPFYFTRWSVEPAHTREDLILRGPRSSPFWIPRNLSHHMIRQTQTGDTVQR
jgi:hypothetical protein